MVQAASGDPAPTWPLPNMKPMVDTRRGKSFGAYRAATANLEAHYHAGVDLSAVEGATVVACESGYLARTHGFNGPGAVALLQQCDSGLVIAYCELAPNSWEALGLPIGQWVKKGQPIGAVGVNPHGSTMCHFMTLVDGTRRTPQWPLDSPAPAELLDPTPYLLLAAGSWAPSKPAPSKPAPSRPFDDTSGGLAAAAALAALVWVWSR